MRIGILVLSVGSFGNKGFYNLQEMGLAKVLDKYCKEVKVYKLVDLKKKFTSEKIEETKNATITCIPVKTIGSNGVLNMKYLDHTLDVLICFSDTQIMLPRVYRWAKNNSIELFPYIGTIASHSSNYIVSRAINILNRRNIKVYKKCMCLSKTPEVQKQLKKEGIKNIKVCPVGLDLTLMKKNYEQIDIDILKKKYGYTSNDQVILFIGRMIEEKQPFKMLEIFSKVKQKDSSFKLLMVGKGELLPEIKNRIKAMKLSDSVRQIDQLPNSDIWELYRIARCFVNLNQHEIYGMVLLEAMYYGCRVIAWKAPGPNFIIEDNESGYLVDSENEAIERIFSNNNIVEAMKKRVQSMFVWDSTARQIIDLIEEK